MIRRLSLSNFKPFGRPQDVRLAPVTLLYGPNSGGKSSIIQSLLLLRQSFTDADATSVGLVTRGEWVDLGDFRSLVHRHDTKREVTVTVAFDRPDVARPALHFRLQGLRELGVTYKLAKTSKKSETETAILASITYGLTPEHAQHPIRLTLKPSQSGADDEWITSQVPGVPTSYSWSTGHDRSAFADLFLREFKDRDARLRKARRGEETEDRNWAIDAGTLDNWLGGCSFGLRQGLPARLIAERESRQQTELFTVPVGVVGSVLEGLVDQFRKALALTEYLGPLRSHPARFYVVSGGPRVGVGKSGEHTPQVLSQRFNRDLSIVNHWFDQFEIPYELRLSRTGDEVTGTLIVLQLRDRRVDTVVGPSDVGFGIGQLLPILVEGLASNGRTICVEQPEIHLHPRLQAHLADFFIETAGLKEKTSLRTSWFPNQWIVETHSETLIRRIQRRMRAGDISPEDVSVIYVDPGEDGSRVLELRLDEHGEFIDEWPDGFFEEAFNERFERNSP